MCAFHDVEHAQVHYTNHDRVAGRIIKVLTRARAVGLCNPYAVTVLDLYTSNPSNAVRTATTRQVRMRGALRDGRTGCGGTEGG